MAARGAGQEAEVFWEPSLGEARKRSAADGRPVLLYLPSPRPGESPRPLQDLAAQRQAAAWLHPARARAAELEEVLTRWPVARFPALLLLDRRGRLFSRWEGSLPADFWTQVERAVRRLRAEEEGVAAALAAAREAWERGDLAGALGGVWAVQARGREGDPEREEAAAIEEAVLARAGEELRSALSQEGLEPDEAVARRLTALRHRCPHPRFEARIERELERIRARPIGGKARGAGSR